MNISAVESVAALNDTLKWKLINLPVRYINKSTNNSALRKTKTILSRYRIELRTTPKINSVLW